MPGLCACVGTARLITTPWTAHFENFGLTRLETLIQGVFSHWHPSVFFPKENYSRVTEGMIDVFAWENTLRQIWWPSVMCLWCRWLREDWLMSSTWKWGKHLTVPHTTFYLNPRWGFDGWTAWRIKNWLHGYTCSSARQWLQVQVKTSDKWLSSGVILGSNMV